MIYRTFLTVCVLLSLALAGCGKNSALQGRVTFEDGTPLTVGTVVFSSADGLARGQIQPDGTYRVGTLKAHDGILPGTYRVFIIGAEGPGGPPQNTGERDSEGNPIHAPIALVPLIDVRYMTAESTPLTCTVPAPGNRFDIIVERPAHLQR
jgi:hypothetical protein